MILEGSLSAVAKPVFASNYSFGSILEIYLRSTRFAHLCTAQNLKNRKIDNLMILIAKMLVNFFLNWWIMFAKRLPNVGWFSVNVHWMCINVNNLILVYSLNVCNVDLVSNRVDHKLFNEYSICYVCNVSSSSFTCTFSTFFSRGLLSVRSRIGSKAFFRMIWSTSIAYGYQNESIALGFLGFLLPESVRQDQWICTTRSRDCAEAGQDSQHPPLQRCPETRFTSDESSRGERQPAERSC